MPAVTVEDMLAARDARAARQAALGREFGLAPWVLDGAVGAIVSVTLVVPGPDKHPDWAARVSTAAMEQVDAALDSAGSSVEVLHREDTDTAAGPQGFVVATGTPDTIKRHLAVAEDTHPWGRLFDLDVVVGGVPLTRSDIDAPPRRCLVCDGPAAPCARSRAHDLPALQAAIEEVLSR